MNLSFEWVSFLRQVSTQPGIYRMYDARGEVIYVGKANNLKQRLRSYFSRQQQNSKTKALVKQIKNIEITVTGSEKEALLLECSLIKTLKPKYNVLMRDDKSFPYIYIQKNHPYPCMKTVRLKQQQEHAYYFGPYPNVTSMHSIVNVLQSIFKLRTCSDAEFSRRQRPCLLYQIQRCSAPCVAHISKLEYQHSVHAAVQFLQGKQADILDEFQQKMGEAAQALNFEVAAVWRDKIRHLHQVQQQQSMICSSGDVDVVELCFQAGILGVIRVVIREGKVLTTDVFFPKLSNMNWYGDIQELWQDVFAEFIVFFYREQPAHIPSVIVCSQILRDRKVLENLLSELRGTACRFHVPKLGMRKDWLLFAQKNLQQAMVSHQSSRMNLQQAYVALEKFLNLPIIQRMECFDVSHTQGQNTAASCVVFDSQGPVKQAYRRYTISDISPGDDCAALRQVLSRRVKIYQAAQEQCPDLIIIDGGQAQVTAAQEGLNMNIPMIGIAKGVSRKPGMEKIVLAQTQQELSLAAHSPVLHLLQRIRDEAHRFAISFHRKKRQKKFLESSLELIPGVGSKRRRHLLENFGGMRALARASVDEIAKVQGIGISLAHKIFEHLHAS